MSNASLSNRFRSYVGSREFKWLVPGWLRRTYRSMRPGISAEQLASISDLVHSQVSGKVLNGPFAGMSYIRCAAGSALSPKLLGTYEKEIAAAVESACKGSYDLCVDIGAAEGYYAVGMAFRKAAGRVIAYEMDPGARQLLQSMCDLNGVQDRIEICPACSTSDLQAVLALAPRPLVICDVDSAELELLDTHLVPDLTRADILVELHDCFRPGISTELRNRFATSHDIETIRSVARHSWDCPASVQLSKRQARIAVQEHRPAPQSWFWMRARQKETGGKVSGGS